MNFVEQLIHKAYDLHRKDIVKLCVAETAKVIKKEQMKYYNPCGLPHDNIDELCDDLISQAEKTE